MEGTWAYHDSYFGESDFLGHEVVYDRRQPVWGMNDSGRILRPNLIRSPEAGQMIMESLSLLYRWCTGREWTTRDGHSSMN